MNSGICGDTGDQMEKGFWIHRFTVEVDCSDIRREEEEQLYSDYGMLALPEGYRENGTPARLVICCHGAGGTVSAHDSQSEQQIIAKYLLANGYAVMDVNGLPDGYAEREGIDIRNNVGSPIAVQSYVKAYHYCVGRFNLFRDVFVHGASMGGISSTNLVLSGCVPVIAQTGYCPVLDTWEQIFLHPWSDGLPKTALGKFYGFEKDADGEYLYDGEKLAGFNPMARCVAVGDREVLRYPVPVKFWQCEDDPTVSIGTTKRFVRAIRNAGGIAALRTFPHGGHEPQDYGDCVGAPVGKTVLGEETLRIRPAVEETFRWIRRFD